MELLAEGTSHVCVYCDWHDDYVTEIGSPPTRYVFHQVKGRKSSQGPWKFKEFFGVAWRIAAKPSKTPATVAMDAVVPRMVLHHANFGDSCAGLVFVTNEGLDLDLTKFLDAIRVAATSADLPEDEKNAFEHLARAYVSATPKLAPSAATIFSWLKSATARTEQGHLEDEGAALLELADVVSEYSEIDLRQREAKQIAREIIGRVRSKVSHTTTTVPSHDGQLRQDKGIVVSELLTVLSLSTQAYEQLKAGEGRETVKNLSRLGRFCEKYGFKENLVTICGFKAQWDVWRTVERHFLKSSDYLLLEAKAADILKANLNLQKLIGEAKDLASQFNGLTATPLTGEHVLGLLFSLAAQAEALS